MEYLEKWYGIHGTMPVDMHDMELQSKNPTQPYVPGIMSDLISGINNTNEQRCVLDCPIAVGLPLELVLLDEGQMAWHRTTKDCPLPGPNLLDMQLRKLLFHKSNNDCKVPLPAAKSLYGPHDLNDYDAETVTIYSEDLLSLEVIQGNTTQTPQYIDETLWRTLVAEVGEVVDLGNCLLEFTHAV
ncbi:uncharacterized protein F5147DRAFT_658154 [Suillus discolor]|uniref:Uncharacterized protein n=1 Tax=Suillus discolor TaxID=1912936 RepID=A0A9P7EV73_9AGAM|nr:uncharacterized protein F5147DRAFT_658154 [Suillus discolor]KAG2090487.1 hypothetical protein F5147DRAFT_658154 [Suillus discolor]